ncbi:type I pantothenate kinase [Corynebacterium kroppenstedtii]|uniref:type I pantothenate kinase n=1 Tax=Corynebacterium sp. PCR 32 TaxID=3351342 RepID=UPI0030A9ED4C
MSRATESSPYLEFNRDQWKRLRMSQPQVLTEDEVKELRGIGENIALDEVTEVYLPLSRLIHLQVEAHRRLGQATATFMGEDVPHIPFIIGIAGSVAVGKSTTARLLQRLLQRWDSHPKVDLVTTDGFLYPTEELTRRGILDRKGYPESFNRRALLRFITDVKAGCRNVQVPVYSHELYNIVPDEFITVDRPDILIVEGLNVLQTGATLMVSDFFEFSVYVDAHSADIERWYVERFLELRSISFSAPNAHFHHFANLDDEAAVREAREIWQRVNLPNLTENVLPTRPRASLVLMKGRDHAVERVRMRKL